MLEFLRPKKPQVTVADIERMQEDIREKQRIEEELFDEYLKAGRPVKMELVTRCTFGAPVWSPMLDYDDWLKWKAERTANG